MRQITVDFSSQTTPLFAGYIGEHNATELIAIKPNNLSGTIFSLVFMTGGKIIHSRSFSADEEIRLLLWRQLTQDNTLYVQLEAYDDSGDYLGKSAKAKLLLSNSVHGTELNDDTDNADVYSEIAQNSLFREILEDNVDTLKKLTTSEKGEILFDGEPVGGAVDGLTEEQAAALEANTEARHTHENEGVLKQFGVNYNGSRPTYGGADQSHVIPFLDDVIGRDNEVRMEIPNKAIIEGTTLKFKSNIYGRENDLFLVELPSNEVSKLKIVEASLNWEDAIVHTYDNNFMTFECSLLPVDARVKRVEIPNITDDTVTDEAYEYIALEDMVAKDPNYSFDAPYFVMYPKNKSGAIFTVAAAVFFPIQPNTFYEYVNSGKFDENEVTIKIYYEIEE